ncbi:McrB family protein [Shouchella lehensis]|uniref:AAA family ATPase n=1 Tax=Shouchella lehensis TaxID=300825 RepID=A0A4Y7WLH1_9BACI|nr:AAA family ATPase [Shouchella lehensis]MBG9783453.1 hypothetical protein [Shouchella lehensis]TES49154.1 AAA family ATPase [Shouchella lehensis]
MTKYYISESSLTESYNLLTNNEFQYPGEFFTLLILKHAGLSQHDFLDLSEEEVKRDLFNATSKLAYLFISDEFEKVKNNFINPFSMNGWRNNPSETVKQWSTQRLINNVTGGGRLWKRIVITDPENSNSIKLKHNYLDYFKDMKQKLNLEAISIWLVRFTAFDKEAPTSHLIRNFYEYFNVKSDEKTFFFTASPNIPLTFSEEMVSSHFIRSLIGNPSNNPNWITENETLDIETQQSDKDLETFNGDNVNLGGNSLDLDSFLNIVEKAKQVILTGPPGTSKSYLAKKASLKFDFVKRIQFHPQYSYQNFIGGKILENGTLIDKKGELILLIEDAMLSSNINKEFLLVIEEINRANVSQVFGEMIQLLDRNESLNLTFNDEMKEYTLPENLKIIGTMNTTDRTVGRIDYALKRRFYQIYCKPDIEILVDKTQIEGNEFSISDLLSKINQNLYENLSNKEMVLGHAIFLKDFVYSETAQKFIWSLDDFENLFNYVVLPLIEDYCNGNPDLITNIIGERLYSQLTGNEFSLAIKEFLS